MSKIVVFVGLLVFLLTPVSAEDTVPTFHETRRIGRGAVLDVEWHPYGSYILVNTVIGAWLYGPMLEDVAYLPEARLGTFSPSGSWIVGVDAENRLTLWQTAENFKEVARLPGHERYVIALEWSPDGKRLASVDRDGVLLVWDMEAREILYRLHMDDGREIAWSREGSYLAVTGVYDVRVWNQDGEVVLANHSEYESIWNPAWRDDTQLLYSVCETAGCDVQLWNVPTQTMIFQRGSSFDLRFSPDGALMAFGMWVENTDTGATVASLDLESLDSNVAAWSPDGQYVAFGEFVWSPDKRATTWVMEAQTGKIVAEFPRYTRSVKGIYWRRDNNTLLVIDEANQLFLLDVDREFDTTAFFNLKNAVAHTIIGTAADWKSDGSLITTGDTLGNVLAWDQAGTEVLRLKANSYPVYALAWQPGGNLLALNYGHLSENSDHNIYVLNIREGIEQAKLVMTISHTSVVYHMAWSPDGKILASAQQEHTLHLWRPDRPNVVESFYPSTGDFYGTYMFKIEWSPDSTNLAFLYSYGGAGTDGVRIADIATGQLFPGNPENWSRGSWGWTPDGEYIWAREAANECADSSSPLELRLMRGYGEDAEMQRVCLSDAPEHISELVFSPDKRLLAGFDRTDWYEGGDGMVWNLQTGQKLLDYKEVVSISWSPNGAYLVVSHTDEARTVEIVDVALGKAVIRFQSGQSGQIVWSPDSRKFALLDQGVMFIYERNS